MENNLDLYRAKLPYPPIVVVKPNKHYAEIIQTSFAGAVSEFSAISQYIYHHLRTEDQYPEISKIVNSDDALRSYRLINKLVDILKESRVVNPIRQDNLKEIFEERG